MQDKLNLQEISFIEGKFDAVICLNTLIPEISIIKQLIDVPILAADGAAIYLIEHKIEPDFIIGDLDSFNSSIYYDEFPKDKLIYLPEQETNDFEKTIRYALENNMQNILVFGIHGGEYEHSLNNWSVLSKFSKLANILVFDKYRYGFCLNESAEIQVNKNEIISLIPRGLAKISTNNLQWNLHNEILELGVREGARNKTLDKNCLIDIHQGELFVFVDSRFPKIMIKR